MGLNVPLSPSRPTSSCKLKSSITSDSKMLKTTIASLVLSVKFVWIVVVVVIVVVIVDVGDVVIGVVVVAVFVVVVVVAE